MFDAAESIGSEAAEYLSQLGYTYTVIGVYVGPEVDVEAVHDDRNPNHSELLEEYNGFSKELISNKISEVVSSEVFDSANVKLNNIIFTNE